MIGNLLRFSSGKDGEEVTGNNDSENNTSVDEAIESDANENDAIEYNEVTSEASADEAVTENEPAASDQLESNPEEPSAMLDLQPPAESKAPVTREKHYTLDELGSITRKTLADENIEVSKVKPFIWSVIEAYTDRFQAFPFDAEKALFSYLELDERPASELQELVKRIEALYEKQQGEPMRKPEQPVQKQEPSVVPLASEIPSHDELFDEELKELRETLKYAAMVGERLDDTI